MKDHPLYQTYKGLRARCYNQNHKDYHLYGGRGVVLSEDWQDFWAFARDMGERPEGCSVDRKDKDGPYSKENCRWATATEQSRNRRGISEDACPSGHKYTEENTGLRSNGHRYCKQCNRDRKPFKPVQMELMW